MNISKYKKHHEDIVAKVVELAGKLKPEVIAADPDGVHALLAEIAAMLSIHLAMEDNVLYPTILEKGSDAGKKIARDFSTEMGNIKQIFGAYVGRWSSINTLIEKSNEFIKETEGLIAALGDRVARENSELYPLAESIDI